ncbi:hypothetical protein G9A89_002218 [Geosiphon pyriformis]|nr:hypothetical protein G9A89_002218 [Geosiphon pyriformis]
MIGRFAMITSKEIPAGGNVATSTNFSATQKLAAQPACGGEGIEDYNSGLHVGALFIILGTSSFVVKHFGTGVILATAFIHMLPSAFANLTDPCLPEIWSKTYPAFAGAIAMGATLVIFFIEYLAVKASEEIEAQDTQKNVENGTSIKDEDQKQAHNNIPDSDHSHGHILSLTARTQTIGIIILEFGICLHSVIIGIALSVSTGSEFTSLLCALVFHQMFEGLGLGARIAEIQYLSGSLRPWLMSLAYGTTTPIGIALGLGLHSSYDPESQTALIVQGILDSVSAGILLYAAMVELLAADFIIDSKIRKGSKQYQIAAFVLLLLGAGLMALIGRWA